MTELKLQELDSGLFLKITDHDYELMASEKWRPKRYA
jgi:hypothetical protein